MNKIDKKHELLMTITQGINSVLAPSVLQMFKP